MHCSVASAGLLIKWVICGQWHLLLLGPKVCDILISDGRGSECSFLYRWCAFNVLVCVLYVCYIIYVFSLVQPLCWLCNIDCIPVCPCILEQMTPLQLLWLCTVRTVSGRAQELELWPNYMSFFLCPLFCVWVNNSLAHTHTHGNQNLIYVSVCSKCQTFLWQSPVL